MPKESVRVDRTNESKALVPKPSASALEADEAAASTGARAAKRPADSRSRILACATEEFLEKGFAGASLRSIAAAAQVTTGAIYGYFAGKAALFDAVVAPAADELRRRYAEAQEEFYRLPLEAQTFERMQDYESVMVNDLLDFVYDNREAFVLVSSRSAGTAWERYLDWFIDLEIESTFRYVREMRARGLAVNDVDPCMARILAGMFFHGYFEPLQQGMDRAEAHAFIADYERFFHAGYEELMNPLAGRAQGR